MPCVAPVTIAVWPSSLAMRMISTCRESPSNIDPNAFQSVAAAAKQQTRLFSATEAVTRSAL